MGENINAPKRQIQSRILRLFIRLYLILNIRVVQLTITITIGDEKHIRILSIITPTTHIVSAIPIFIKIDKVKQWLNVRFIHFPISKT